MIRSRSVAAALAGVAGALLASFGPLADHLQRLEFDALVETERPARPVAEAKVAVVGLDEATWRELTQTGVPGVDRGRLAQLVDRIREAHPKLVALDMVFAEPRKPADDTALADALGKCPEPLVAAALKLTAGQFASELRAPIPALTQRNVGIGISNTAPDPDGIVRRIVPELECQGARLPHLAVEIARRALGANTIDVREGRLALLPSPCAVELDPRTGAMWLPFRAAGSLTPFPAWMLLGDRPDPAVMRALENKIVLVGATALAAGDQHLTPVGKAHGRMSLTPGVLVLAQAVEALVGGERLEPLPWRAHGALLFAASTLCAALSLALPPFAGLLLLALLATACWAASVAAFDGGLLLSGAQLWIACALAYGATLLLRAHGAGAPISRGVEESETLLAELRSPDLEALAATDPSAAHARLRAALSGLAPLEDEGAVVDVLGAGAVRLCWPGPPTPRRAAQLLDALLAGGGLAGWHTAVHAGRVVVGGLVSRSGAARVAMGPDAALAARLCGEAARLHLRVLATSALRDAAATTHAFRELLRVRHGAAVLTLYEPANLAAAARDPLRRVFAEYESAHAALLKLDWRTAREHLYRALEPAPDDGPSRALLARIDELERHPPPEGWDGT